MSEQASHGVDATPQTQAEDGTNKGGNPPAAQPSGAQPPAGQQPGAQPPAGQQPPLGGADAAPAGLYNPNGTIPAHLLGQDDKGTIDKLLGAYNGARTEIAKGKPAIPEAKDYQYNWSDKVKSLGVIPADDPVAQAFSEIAHEHGFTQQQMDAIPKLFDRLVDKGLIEKPFDSAALLSSLAPAEFKGTPEEKQARGAQRLQAAENWIKQLDATAHGIDDAMKQELRLLTTSLDGVRLVEKFMNGGMNVSVSPGGGNPPAAVTQADLNARVADPRNNAYDPKFDPAFAEETRNMFKKVYPD
jgi:hypothetical protein